jgi:hypothetical protein
MINKKALIIGYPGRPGEENYCKGVFKDMDNYYSHLTTIHGGAWNGGYADYNMNEVFSKVCIEKYDLKNIIEYFNGCAEYSVIIFAGHGSYDDHYGTIIRLNERQDIPITQIKLNAPRQLFIIDCCRRKASTELLEENLKKSLSIESFSNNRDIYRMRFNQLLAKSINGIVEVYSCSVDEYSQDISEQGGLFSSKFLDSASGSENLSIFKTFEKAKPRVQRLSRNRQTPVIIKPRMDGNTFPFYIS